MYQIQETAKISGVSVRTLHYYDSIGLLCPNKASNGYRYYTDEDINKLQKIMYYKYLGFPLKKIKELIISNNDNISELATQLDLLKNEEKRLKTLIKTLEDTINESKGGRKMELKDKFKGFTYNDNKKYREEAINKYGEEVILKSEKKQKGKEKQVTKLMNEIFFDFEKAREEGLSYDNEKVALLARKLHETICEYYFDCTKEVFLGIGKGYVEDERFKNNIDKFGKGLAEYVFEAIKGYVE